MKATLCAVVLFLLAGCASPSDSAGAPTSINTMCPIGGEAVTAKSPFVTYEGHKVAFCCEGCAEDWVKQPDAEKHAQVAKMLAGK